MSDATDWRCCYLPVCCCVDQLGNRQRIRLFAMKELTTLHGVLVEEKACREALAALCKKNPVSFYEEFRAELEHARRLGFTVDAEPRMHEAQRLFDSVKDRIEVRACRCVSVVLCPLSSVVFAAPPRSINALAAGLVPGPCFCCGGVCTVIAGPYAYLLSSWLVVCALLTWM